jgi:hypothetical protein
MNQRFLYIIDRDVALANISRINFHGIDLPNGQMLVSAEFMDEAHQESFHQHASCEPVAHDGETVSHGHAAQLAHLGVQKNHTHKQVRQILKKIHGLM